MTILKLLIGLYPSQWRARYGAELEALVEDDTRASTMDILKGALSMRFAQASPRQLVAGFTVLGLFAASIAFLAIPNVYRSTGVAAVPDSTPHAAIQQAVARAKAAPVSASDHSKDELNRNIRIATVTSADRAIFTVAFDSPNPQRSQAVTQAFMDAILKDLPQPARILDSASLPKTPISPAPIPILTAGTLVGIALGLAALGYRRLRARKL